MQKYLILLVLLIGCTTEKKVTKWNESHKDRAAKYCSEVFPCLPGKPDSIIKFLPGDTAGYNQAILELQQNLDIVNEINDSLIRVLIADTSCKKYAAAVEDLQRQNDKLKHNVRTVSKPVHDTSLKVIRIPYADSSRDYYLQAQVNQCHDEGIKKDVKISELNNAVKKYKKFVWYFWILCALIALWIFRKPILSLIKI
jgi:hypothetical protein